MNTRIYVAAACAALLASCSTSERNCSFSGCNTTSTTGGVTGGGVITVDETTALLVLREAWFAATASADIPAFVVATGIGDTSGGIALAAIKSNTLPSKSASRNTVFVDPFGPTTYNCPVSGQFIVSGDVADPMTVTAGDFAVYDATACDSGSGYTVDGNHQLDIAAIDGDVASGQYEQAQLLTFTNFTAASAQLSTGLNGDHTAVIDTRPLNSVTTSFSGNTLTIAESPRTVTIGNYFGFSSVGTISPFDASLDVSGNGNSSLTQGSFVYFTSETMQKAVGQDPTDGIFDVEGAGRSTARAAIDDVTLLVRVQVDANASGNYESTTDMTWEEFLNGTVPLTAGEFEFD